MNTDLMAALESLLQSIPSSDKTCSPAYGGFCSMHGQRVPCPVNKARRVYEAAKQATQGNESDVFGGERSVAEEEIAASGGSTLQYQQDMLLSYAFASLRKYLKEDTTLLVRVKYTENRVEKHGRDRRVIRLEGQVVGVENP